MILRKDLLKENIDGEAIGWAASRLRLSGQNHKYLIVLSDGTPVDDSTMYENGEPCLDRHLRNVIQVIELASDIQLAAIGLRYRVGRRYGRGTNVTTLDELDSAVLWIIEQLLCQQPTAARSGKKGDDGGD